MTRRGAVGIAAGLAVSAFGAKTKPRSTSRVRLMRVPNGGIQPQVLAGSPGTLHLLYYAGEARAGNIFYCHSRDKGATFSTEMRVNSHPGSAVAAGTIRGAQGVLGRGGRLHVAWNGSSQAEQKGPVNRHSGKPGSPMLYSRLNDAGTAFEPERNVMHVSFGLDGGGSVAADLNGNVWVAWHAIGVDPKSESGRTGEAARQVWLATSNDDGRTFSNEQTAWDRHTGACACCGLKIFATRKGSVHGLYRSATESVHRDIYLITSKDRGRTFQGGLLHKWDINACPMSSMDFAENATTVVGAWETSGQVYWARITDKPDTIQPIPAPRDRWFDTSTGEGKGRKHPRVAINGAGEVLLVWTEGTGWQRGGSLAWQLYSRSGELTSEQGTLPGVPAWSFGAPAVNDNGGFLVLY